MTEFIFYVAIMAENFSFKFNNSLIFKKLTNQIVILKALELSNEL